jgi:hypothetical protein
MPKLVARGPGGEEKRCRLRPERPVRLGRRPGVDDSAADPFEVPWEGKLSRNQADLRWALGRLEVERVAEAKNPLFFKGQEKTSFSMVLGALRRGRDHVHPLRGSGERRERRPTPLEIVGYTMAEMRETRYRDPDQRIEVLATLPDVLRSAASDEELFSRLVLLLFAAIPDADAAAIVRVFGKDHRVEVFYWDSRTATTSAFKPSKRLIVDAVENRRQSVRSLWSPVRGGPQYTIADALDWAFCTPCRARPAPDGVSTSPGSPATPGDLRPDEVHGARLRSARAMRDFRSPATAGDARPVLLPVTPDALERGRGEALGPGRPRSRFCSATSGGSAARRKNRGTTSWVSFTA